MANSVGKFGPYDRAASAQPGSAAQLAVVRACLSTRIQTGTELVRSRIALHVRLGRLAPGDRLPDAGVIADELGMSEITVRRALETMCQDSLLDRRRGRTGGTFISQGWDVVAVAFHDREQAASLEDFHLLLECGLTARRAGDLPADRLGDLRGLVEEMDATEDLAALLRLETRFHLALAEALGDDVLGEQVADLLGRLCLLSDSPSLAAMKARNRCHADLLAALRLGRLDAAVEALKVHQRAGAAEA